MALALTLAGTPAWPSCYAPTHLLPERMRWLHPAALAALRPLADDLVLSDCYRSPAASLEARRRKAGVARPGYSAHNFGLAVDLAVAATLRGLSIDKAALDARMLAAGWRCYRATPDEGPESWHYTYGAPEPGASGVEAAIEAVHGPASAWAAVDTLRAQAALQRWRLYSGRLDGRPGPLTTEALRACQRAWGLRSTGRLDAATQRTIAVVDADVRRVSA